MENSGPAIESFRPASLARPVLIETMTSMVLISIHPFAVRKILLAIVAFLCFSALCLADPVLMVRRHTSHMERLPIPRTSVSSWQESGGDLQVGTMDLSFANFASTDLSARQPRFTSNDSSGTDLRPAMPSSVFRNAACATHSSGARPVNDRGRSPEPTRLAAL
jgi:hypothetical protein